MVVDVLFQNRVMLELKSIREINQKLGKLVTPSHPESQFQPGPELTDLCSERRILRLQDPNLMLTDEVGQKNQLLVFEYWTSS